MPQPDKLGQESSRSVGLAELLVAMVGGFGRDGESSGDGSQCHKLPTRKCSLPPGLRQRAFPTERGRDMPLDKHKPRLIRTTVRLQLTSLGVRFMTASAISWNASEIDPPWLASKYNPGDAQASSWSNRSCS